MTIALYPGAFDPITNGHLDIARRATRLFDKVIIGVYDTPSKNLWFTTEERVDLALKTTKNLPGVEITPFSGLTVNFAKAIGAQTIVRGLRVGTDFEREFDMALMNKKLEPDVELVCLISSQQYQFVSSSRVKEVISLGGNIEDLIPGCVAEALRRKISGE